jgi:hypothetical protein
MVEYNATLGGILQENKKRGNLMSTDKFTLVASNCSSFESRSSSLSSSAASGYCNCKNCSHYENDKCQEHLFDSIYRTAKLNENSNKAL